MDMTPDYNQAETADSSHLKGKSREALLCELMIALRNLQEAKQLLQRWLVWASDKSSPPGQRVMEGVVVGMNTYEWLRENTDDD